MPKIDVHTHLGADLLFYFGGGYPYALDLPQLTDQGRRHGLDHWVVFPMVTHTALSLSGLKEGKIRNGADQLEQVPYAWENRRLLRETCEIFPDLGARTLPFLMVDPARFPLEQVRELRSMRRDFRFYGLKIQATILQSPIRALLDTGSCLLDFAESENLPVLIHTSIAPEDRWSQVADILEVARHRPAIRFCLAHSCRFDRAGLDEVASLPNTWFDCSAHVIHCRLAVQNHPAVAPAPRRFLADYQSPSRTLAALSEAYPDRLVWGSDAPFHSYVSTASEKLIRMTCSYAEEAQPLLDLPEDDQQRIAFRNTLAFLGLTELPRVKVSPRPLLRNLASLAEGPCWHPGEKALYFTDIPAGRIWRFDPASGKARIFHEGEVTGGFTLQEDGSWLLFRKKDLAWIDADGRLKETRAVDLPGAQRFNDVIADGSGRVYAGTIGSENESGGLYRFDPDGCCQKLFQGTHIANGMAFSPCGRYFYWICTTTRTIYRFAYQPETGVLSDRFLLYTCDPAEGLPDGLTVDAEGNLWSARWGSGLVVLLSPQGKILGRFDFPESNITSLAWGGEELRDLYVTAAREDGQPGVHDLFVLPGAGPGKPESRSRLSPPSVPSSRAAVAINGLGRRTDRLGSASGDK